MIRRDPYSKVIMGMRIDPPQYNYEQGPIVKWWEDNNISQWKDNGETRPPGHDFLCHDPVIREQRAGTQRQGDQSWRKRQILGWEQSFKEKGKYFNKKNIKTYII